MAMTLWHSYRNEIAKHKDQIKGPEVDKSLMKTRIISRY